MQVYLLYSPTRTRDYTSTLLDISSDLFVPCTKLEEVCATDEAAIAARKRLVGQLEREAPPARGITYHQTLETGLYNKMLPRLWEGAVRILDRELEDHANDEQMPDTVWVVHRTRITYAWDGSDHTTLEPIGVFTTEEAAAAVVKLFLAPLNAVTESGRPLASAMRAMGLQVGDFIDFAEMPLTGVPSAAS